MRYFDFESVAREANIPADRMKQLRECVRQDFPRDQMMYELHVLRACMAIRDGHVSLEDALRPHSAVHKGRTPE